MPSTGYIISFHNNTISHKIMNRTTEESGKDGKVDMRGEREKGTEKRRVEWTR